MNAPLTITLTPVLHDTPAGEVVTWTATHGGRVTTGHDSPECALACTQAGLDRHAQDAQRLARYRSIWESMPPLADRLAAQGIRTADRPSPSTEELFLRATGKVSAYDAQTGTVSYAAALAWCARRSM